MISNKRAWEPTSHQRQQSHWLQTSDMIFWYWSYADRKNDNNDGFENGDEMMIIRIMLITSFVMLIRAMKKYSDNNDNGNANNSDNDKVNYNDNGNEKYNENDYNDS